MKRSLKSLKWKERASQLRGILFVRMISSYLIIIFVSMLVYYSMYTYAFDNMRKYILTTGADAQRVAVRHLESQLDNANAILVQLSNDMELRKFASVARPLTSGNYLSLVLMQKTIQKFSRTNDDVENVIIYYRNSDAICSNRVASLRTDSAYANGLGYKNLTLAEWSRRITQFKRYAVWPAMEVSMPDCDQVISFVRHFPCDILGNAQAVAIVQMNVYNLVENLRIGALSRSAASQVADDQGNVIFQWSSGQNAISLYEHAAQADAAVSEKEIDGARYVLFKTPLEAYGLTCITAFDMNTLMAETTQHTTLLVRVLAIALIGELIYAFLVTHRRYRSIYEILLSLSGKPKKGENELRTIQDSIIQMQSEHEELRHKFFNQQNTIQALSIGRILGLEPGANTSDLKFGGIPENCLFHLVLVLCGTRESDLNAQAEAVLEYREWLQNGVSEKHIADHLRFCEYALDRCAVILSFSSRKRLFLCTPALTELLGQAGAQRESRVCVGVGLPAEDTEQISRSFSEARLAAQRAETTHKHVMLYDSIASRRENYDYSSELESTLQKCIVGGKSQDAMRIVDALYQKGQEDAPSPQRLQLLLNEIYGTLLKVRQLNLLREPVAERRFYFLLNEIEFNASPEQRYASIRQAIQYYCGEVAQTHSDNAPTLCERISKYVSDNYSDTELCLESIARAFGITSKYLSKCFKEEAGYNLSTFLTDVRMKQVKELLKDGRQSIPEIARQCGYANLNTFYKVFKRYWGISPGAFRDALVPANTDGNEVEPQ